MKHLVFLVVLAVITAGQLAWRALPGSAAGPTASPLCSEETGTVRACLAQETAPAGTEVAPALPPPATDREGTDAVMVGPDGVIYEPIIER